MSEEEKKAMWYLEEVLVDTTTDIEQWKVIENLIKKQQKEIENLNLCLDCEEKASEGLREDIKSLLQIEPNDNFISKDEILDILGYEENDEQRNYMTKDKILSLIETIFEECDRLEDIEDRKIQLEIQNIENKRDKDWEDKIKEKINYYDERGYIEIAGAFKLLLEEN